METKNQKKEPFIRLENISKSFGNVVANSNVNLDIYKGEILSLLGENGSGKTTLMNMLAGIYFPDCGTIYINGKPAVITSPKDSHKYNIGMIHQHFKLIDVFDSIENIILGIKPERNFFGRSSTASKNRRNPITHPRSRPGKPFLRSSTAMDSNWIFPRRSSTCPFRRSRLLKS